MPTYRFKCPKCNKTWEERQPILLNGKEHTSVCSSCNTLCKNNSFGGTGTLLKGRYLNKYLEGFPDHTDKLNKQADEEGEQLEKKHDAYIAEQKRTEKD